MAHTVTLLADHKGVTRPKVSGDEYVVDAVIDITTYVNGLNGGNIITAESLGLSTITSAHITGQESITFTGTIMCSAGTGAYSSSSQFVLLVQELLQATPAEESNGSTTTYSFRVRVYGNL